MTRSLLMIKTNNNEEKIMSDENSMGIWAIIYILAILSLPFTSDFSDRLFLDYIMSDVNRPFHLMKDNLIRASLFVLRAIFSVLGASFSVLLVILNLLSVRKLFFRALRG